VIRVTDDPGFCLARARNLGARAAAGPWLAFVDADILLVPDFARTLRPLLEPSTYLLAQPAGDNGYGTCLCMREDFRSVGGYDEVLRNWGGEDRDLYLRLQMRGVRRRGFPAHLIEPIGHDDQTRLARSDLKDRDLLLKIARLYVAVKIDVLRLGGRPIPFETRRNLYERARGAVLKAADSGAAQTVLEISFSQHPFAPSHEGWRIASKITYTITDVPASDVTRSPTGNPRTFRPSSGEWPPDSSE
jgi:glycosyltransferase involved in cell wall biosynthesis